MANLREIKGRIDSVKSTMQVTRTMEMISTARIRRALDRAERAMPFKQALTRMLANVAGAARDGGQPLLRVPMHGVEEPLGDPAGAQHPPPHRGSGHRVRGAWGGERDHAPIIALLAPECSRGTSEGIEGAAAADLGPVDPACFRTV